METAILPQIQPADLSANIGVLSKPAEPQAQFDSQGEVIQSSSNQASAEPQQPPSNLSNESSYEDISLWDTPLCGPADTLCPPTDDSELVHAIISCGHVLKSTHDLARWSEKTGARRVNNQDSIDSISDLAVTLQAPSRAESQGNSNTGGNGGGRIGPAAAKYGGRRNNKSWKLRTSAGQGPAQPSQIISCGPVLKSTHDLATWSEKRGAHAVNSAGASAVLDDVATNQEAQGQSSSKIISCGPVLKSTHDMATWSEKRGANAVNSAGASVVLDDLASNQPAQAQGFSEQREPSSIISCGPVLKSTHDLATWSEKRGANAVNSAESSNVLDDVAKNQGTQTEPQQIVNSRGMQAGGNSLQSGLDTQAGNHVQLDSEKSISETPERAMAELHLHV